MPPATTTTSPPAARGDRPRVPERAAEAETAPGSVAQIAFVTAPTARTVRTTGAGRPTAPLTEIGTSPTPNA